MKLFRRTNKHTYTHIFLLHICSVRAKNFVFMEFYCKAGKIQKGMLLLQHCVQCQHLPFYFELKLFCELAYLSLAFRNLYRVVDLGLSEWKWHCLLAALEKFRNAQHNAHVNIVNFSGQTATHDAVCMCAMS